MSGMIRKTRKSLFPPPIHEEQPQYVPVAWPSPLLEKTDEDEEAKDISFLFDLPLGSFMTQADFRRMGPSFDNRKYWDYITQLSGEAEEERRRESERNLNIDMSSEQAEDKAGDMKNVARNHIPMTRSMTRTLRRNNTRTTRSMTKKVDMLKFA